MIQNLTLPNGKVRISNDDQYAGMYHTLKALAWKEEEIQRWIKANVHFMYTGVLLPFTIDSDENLDYGPVSKVNFVEAPDDNSDW